jgi:hypothetical protein
MILPSSDNLLSAGRETKSKIALRLSTSAHRRKVVIAFSLALK